MKRAIATVLLGGALAALGLSGGACELLTHANDFAVDAGVPYNGFCNKCPESEADLHHPPCPAGGDGSDGETYVYVSRYVHFGKPEDWTGKHKDAFHLGFDLDCSSRPKGTPVLCTKTDPEGAIPIAWDALPHGIDNSLVQRIFGPLYEAAQAAHQNIDLDKLYSQGSADGTNGLIVTIDGWNGTPNDDHVTLNVYTSPGVSPGNGKPRWDGTDFWDRYSDAVGADRYFRVANADAYVSGGTLVADYRSRGDVSFLFKAATGTFRLLLHDVVFAGQLHKDKLDEMTMVALADVSSASESIPDAARVLGSCDQLAMLYLNARLPQLLVGAADMPSVPHAKKTDPCDAVSFGWSFDAEQARLGGFQPPEDISDAGCPDGG